MLAPRRAWCSVLAAVLVCAGSGCVLIVDPFGYQFGSGGPSCSAPAPARLAPTHGFAQTKGFLEGGGLALDPQGNIVAAGRIDSATDGPDDFAFAGADVVPVPAHTGGMFLASFHPDGTAAFVRGFLSNGPAGTPTIGSVLVVNGSSSAPPGIVVAGQFGSSLNIGQDLLVGQSDAFVAKFDELGIPLWARSFADNDPRVVADSAGDLLIAMRGGGSIALEPECARDNGTDPGMWLAKLRGRDGTCVWAKKLLVGPSSNPFGLAYDPAHNVGVITGDTNGDYFGPANGQTEAFVHAFTDADGTPAWLTAARFGPIAMEATPTARWGEQVRVSPCGDIFVAGNFQQNIFLGAPWSFTNDHPDTKLGTQLFLAKLSAEDGTVAWAKTFPSDGGQAVHGLAMGPGGEIAITGEVVDNPGSQGIDFGGGFLAADPPGQAINAFVAAFVDGSSRPSFLFATRLADGGKNSTDVHAWDVAAEDSGGLVVTGSFGNTIRFSSTAGEVAITTSYGAFFARYEP
jgi:hypothetical protein